MILYESSRSYRAAVAAPFAGALLVAGVTYRVSRAGVAPWFALSLSAVFAAFMVYQLSYVTTYRVRLDGDLLFARAWMRTQVIPLLEVVSVTGPFQGRFGFVRTKHSRIQVMLYGQQKREFYEFGLKLASLAPQPVAVNSSFGTHAGTSRGN